MSVCLSVCLRLPVNSKLYCLLSPATERSVQVVVESKNEKSEIVWDFEKNASYIRSFDRPAVKRELPSLWLAGWLAGLSFLCEERLRIVEEKELLLK